VLATVKPPITLPLEVNGTHAIELKGSFENSPLAKIL